MWEPAIMLGTAFTLGHGQNHKKDTGPLSKQKVDLAKTISGMYVQICLYSIKHYSELVLSKLSKLPKNTQLLFHPSKH